MRKRDKTNIERPTITMPLDQSGKLWGSSGDNGKPRWWCKRQRSAPKKGGRGVEEAKCSLVKMWCQYIDFCINHKLLFFSLSQIKKTWLFCSFGVHLFIHFFLVCIRYFQSHAMNTQQSFPLSIPLSSCVWSFGIFAFHRLWMVTNNSPTGV